MSKSYRVRTEVGKAQNVTFELKQDFDLLEILSLSLTQSDVYTRMCSDFGVVVGRVFANGGYGIPNAKVCIFIPLDEMDANNEVISQLYPYKQSFDKDGDGKRFNLLSSESNHDCHLAVGTFPTISSVLQQQEVRYVFEKYYKYTAKTNEAGDFMIYWIPVGGQTIIMDVDLSDMGCFSMLPEDFKQKGYPESDFDGPRFKDDDAIDALPQILNQQKSIDIKPFWGDEDICQGAITRVDFDLANSGFKLEPTAVFMGSTATDTDKDSVNLNCRPKKHMGELCSLISIPGIIDCVRYTPFFKEDALAYGGVGGTVPVLERYYLQDGGRVIDQFGAFLTHIPMNLDYLITDEFGNLVTSPSPSVGVPTRARCRFRIRPEQAGGSARLRRIGSYLVPNIREFNTSNTGSFNGVEMQSYTFSIEYHDYHPYAQINLIPGAQDFFYDMTFNRVYSPAQHHDHVKHWGRRQFIGIKEILPEQAQQCSTTAMFFPINSAIRNNNFWIILYSMFISFLSFIYGFLSMLVAALAFIVGMIMVAVIFVIMLICVLLCLINTILNSLPNWLISNNLLLPTIIGLGCGQFCVSCNGCGANCEILGLPLGFVLFNLKQTKYPECEKCNCRSTASGDLLTLATNWPCDGMSADSSLNGYNGNPCSCIPNCNGGGTWLGLGIWNGHICCGDTDDVEICCDDSYGFNDDGVAGNADDAAGGGCYVKVICINPTCIVQNLSMVIFHEWGRREKMSQALCNGLMNYVWENNWVTGFLYQFQFNAKLRYNVLNDDYVTDSQYCKKTVYLHPTENVFYYRCTPFDRVTANTGVFIGDDEGVYAPWWDSNFWGGSGGSGNPDHAEGDMDKHIYWPTTITDLGSRNQCVQQVCLDPKFAEECAITDQLGSTTFQDITELVSDIYNMKMDREDSVISTMFPRPHKEIGGDVAQALMQNCMLGVYGYEATLGMSQCDCVASTTTVVTSGLTYPPTNDQNDTGIIVPNAVNAIDSTYHIGWTPFIFTSVTHTMMTGFELVDCVTLDLSASTQEVPYYLWNVQGAPGTAWGSEYNDWGFTLGTYQTALGSGSGWIVDSDGGGGPIYGLFANSLVMAGEFQNDMGNSLTSSPGSGLVHPGNYPVLNQNSLSTTVFSQPLFYYFGLRPGRTAYNMFLRLYVDEELADTVV